MAKGNEAEIGSAMWHRRVNKEVEIAVAHTLKEMDLLEPLRLKGIIDRRIDAAIKKAVSKIATPELVKQVVHEAFTRRDGRHYVAFQAPSILEGTIRRAIVEEFNKLFDVQVQTKGQGQAGEEGDAGAKPVRLSLDG